MQGIRIPGKLGAWNWSHGYQELHDHCRRNHATLTMPEENSASPLQRYFMRIIISSSATATKKYVAGFANQCHLHVYLVFVKTKRNLTIVPHVHTHTHQQHYNVYIICINYHTTRQDHISMLLKQVTTRFTWQEKAHPTGWYRTHTSISYCSWLASGPCT